MAIRNLDNGKFQVDYRDDAGKRKRKNFDNKADAERFDAQAKVAHREGYSVEELVAGPRGSGKTVGELFDEVFEAEWKFQASSSNTAAKIKFFKAVLGANKPIKTLKMEDVDRFVSILRKGEHPLLKKELSNGTLNRYASVFIKAMKYAEQREWVTTHLRIKKFKENNSNSRIISSEEEDAIIKTALHFGYVDVADGVAVSIDTGLRAGELKRLTSKNIQMVQGEPYLKFFRTKAQNHSLVPLTERAFKVLKSRKEFALQNKGFLFPQRTNWYRQGYEKVLDHLELEGINWHMLRHTCCSRLVMAGMDLMGVKEWMGHKSITMTQRYAHLAPNYLSKGAQLLTNRAW